MTRKFMWRVTDKTVTRGFGRDCPDAVNASLNKFIWKDIPLLQDVVLDISEGPVDCAELEYFFQGFIAAMEWTQGASSDDVEDVRVFWERLVKHTSITVWRVS